ncbi:MAG: hypothetical protein D6679_08275 [Candidatus Hydrogenedentota bacterium]|nr:MAG: hypothetical protein D6679_08275 [Candidatus Hydrogenedentota bacterium]
MAPPSPLFHLFRGLFVPRFSFLCLIPLKSRTVLSQTRVSTLHLSFSLFPFAFFHLPFAF